MIEKLQQQRFISGGYQSMAKAVSSWVARRRRTVIASLVLAIISLGLLMHHYTPHDIATLRLSAGPEGTRRNEVAEYLRGQSHHHGLTIELEPNAGSEECLNLLNAGQLDAAIVSNSVVVPDDDQIMVLGALQHEALHILVRPEIAQQGHLIQALHGKRVNVGQHGSTEHLLAHEFLRFAHLDSPADRLRLGIIPTYLNKHELLLRAQAIQAAHPATKAELIADLPDCLLVLASMPSRVAQIFVEAAGYRLMPFPATRAFISDNLQDSDARVATLQREFMECATIPSHSYFAEQGYPEADCETVGVRLLLVARRDAPELALRALMETVFEGEFSRRILPSSPRELAVPYAVHPVAIAYLDRNKPLATAEILEWFSDGLSLLGAFSAGALSLYGLLWKRSARKPADYFTEIRRVDRMALGEMLDATAPLQAHELNRYLDEHLSRLRKDLIEDICEGRIKGDQVIANILLLLRDTRRNVSALASIDETGANVLPTYSTSARSQKAA
jgi:TRAP-type uncharacterized transport system substrate-binding protein